MRSLFPAEQAPAPARARAVDARSEETAGGFDTALTRLLSQLIGGSCCVYSASCLRGCRARPAARVIPVLEEPEAFDTALTRLLRTSRLAVLVRLLSPRLGDPVATRTSGWGAAGAG